MHKDIPDFSNYIDEYNNIKKRFDSIIDNPSYGFSKYFDITRELPGKFTWVQKLSLDKKVNLDILDISGGLFLFGWLCKQYGHNVTTSDKITSSKEFNEIRSDLIKLFDIQYLELAIRPYTQMSIENKFDVVTIFGSSFQSNWDSQQMLYFLNDVNNILKDSNSIFIIQCNRSGIPLIEENIDKQLIKMNLIESNLHVYPYFLFSKG